MIRPILRYGEKVVHTCAASVNEVTTEIATLINDMIETMHAASGIGLAAPQIGVGLRIFVADISAGRNADDLIVMINPEMVSCEGIQMEDEGCLSVPGFEATVPRAQRAVLRGLDRDGQPHEVGAVGLLTRAFQHELDHLDGTLFVDRLHGIKRDLIVRKINKLKRKSDW